jgi:hypothetical protein
MPGPQTFTITGEHIGDDITPLCLFDEARPGFDALVASFEWQRVQALDSSINHPQLQPVTIEVAKESNIVIGMFIDGEEDLLYRSNPNDDQLTTEYASLEHKAWIQSRRLTSMPSPGFAAIEGAPHHIFILESLDQDGIEEPKGWMCGVGVRRIALTSLYIATRNHIPYSAAAQFNPDFYLTS